MAVRINDGDILLTTYEAQIILKLADCNMSVSETARQMFMHRNTIVYHAEKIKRNTGKDPLNFYDLHELVQIARRTEK